MNAVSVIIPVHDGERFLAEAIDSALAQSLPPGEVLVIDDGSTDGSAAVAAAYGPPVRLLRQGRSGPGVARNAGVEAATGEWLAFLDADDLMTDGRLLAQRDRLLGAAGPAVVFGHNFRFQHGERPLDALRRGDVGPRRLGTVPIPSTLFCRRDLFGLVGPFDPRLRMGEFIYWLTRAERLGVVRDVLPQVVACRRRHDGNTSLNSADQYAALVKLVLDDRRAARGAA